MPKLTLDTLLSKFASITKLNNNFSLISTAIDNTLSRDGTAPNAMGADLDMNSNKIINLVDATTDKEPATKKQLDDAALGTIATRTLDVKGQTAKTHYLIKSQTTTAEPVSPTDGDHYIIPAGATGTSWATFIQDNIAAFFQGAWVEVTAIEGLTAWVEDTNTSLVYDGTSWTDKKADKTVTPNALNATELTISAGAVTPVNATHILASETGTSDDLTDITASNFNSLGEGSFVIKTGHTITVKTTGNIGSESGGEFIATGGQILEWKRDQAGTGVLVSIKQSLPVSTNTPVGHGIKITDANTYDFYTGGLAAFGLLKDATGFYRIGDPGTLGTLAPVFEVNTSGQTKLHCRSVLARELNDPSDVQLTRINGTNAAPTAVLSQEKLGHVYFLAHDGTSLLPNPPPNNQQGQACDISGWTSEAPTQTARGGLLLITTIKNGTVEPQQALTVDNEANLNVLAGAAEATGSVVNKFTVGKGSLSIYMQDIAVKPFIAARKLTDINEGFDFGYEESIDRIQFRRINVGGSTVFMDFARGSGQTRIGLNGGQPSVQIDSIVNAANSIQIKGATTGTAPELNAIGDNVDVGLSLSSKGNGVVSINSNMTVDNQGIIQSSGQPAFMAFNSATDLNVTGNGTFVIVGFDTEDHDQGANFAANIFTAPVAGIYEFKAHVTLSGLTASAARAAIRIITSPQTFVREMGDPQKDLNSRITLEIAAQISLTAGQTAKVDVVVEGETADTVDILGAANPVTWFSGKLVA